MRKLTIIFFVFVVYCFSSCSSNHSSEGESEVYGYEDGTYCSEVDYYNSNTGTDSRYILEVEIEDNALRKIYWPNGGWLDNSHFSPPDISDGEASFTSDRDIDFTVRIIGKEGDCTLDSYAEDDEEAEDLLRKKRYREDERIRQEEEEEQERQEEEEQKNQEERQQKEEDDENEKRREEERREEEGRETETQE